MGWVRGGVGRDFRGESGGESSILIFFGYYCNPCRTRINSIVI